ncbi:transporter substrate-binding domain-containing protein [Bogoriella caseilytica]|uniref:Amino acid ABC transporter substrate-binding protein (PAAT family) n=1 Tax=Bogoriella caseilytica TaxID=56055 RepID=A0A3N2BA05_9MICO|nr:transporter substrate-binding domain-containing protein [Bogoriella caseilytica]ROR72028.1 amino acid ABC transporter substrate-binding protein (PAAT family) [Bogoriella caseilytica]
MTSTTRRRGVALAASAGMLAAVAACTATDGEGGGDALEALQDEGTITVAYAGEEPYSWDRDGELAGASIALQEEIWAELGVDNVEGVLTEWDQLIPGLNAGRFDVVAAGMSITPERCEEAIFSEPEIMYYTSLMVEEGNPYGLQNMQDVQAAVEDEGITLAVMSGAVEYFYADDLGIDTLDVGSPQDGMDAVTGGRADVFALTGASLHAMWDNNPDAGIEVTDPFVADIPNEDGELVAQISPGATVFRPEDTELRDAYNEVLVDITGDADTFESVVGEYGFGEDERPDPEYTAEEFCSGELP